MSGFGDRVKARRKALQLSQDALAKMVKLSQTAIAEIEAGRTRRSLNIVQFADALRVNIEWLESGRGSMEDAEREFLPAPIAAPLGPKDLIVEVAGMEFARLPVFDIQFAAGAGSENYDEQPIGYHMIALETLRSYTDAPLPSIFGFQAIGDSMEKTILDRAWVFADMRVTGLHNPGIYCFDNEGRGLLKRAQQNIEDRSVTLISDNPLYPPQIIKKPERLRVIGRVFMSIHRH